MNRRKALKQTSILLGSALSASVIAGVMSGCKPTMDINWQPKLLTKDQAMLVEELAETILPETNTLGAKSLHVAEFIDLMLKENFSDFDQLQFTKGLAKIDEQAQFFIAKPFLKASPEERQKFLTIQEGEAIKTQQKTGQKPFLLLLKELVLTGYFTSEYAITELMNYNPIPTAFEGCIEEPQKIQVGIEGRSA